jgi:hypothetical protein
MCGFDQGFRLLEDRVSSVEVALAQYFIKRILTNAILTINNVMM